MPYCCKHFYIGCCTDVESGNNGVSFFLVLPLLPLFPFSIASNYGSFHFSSGSGGKNKTMKEMQIRSQLPTDAVSSSIAEALS